MLACRNRRIKWTNSSVSYQYVIHTAIIIYWLHVFKCAFSSLWPIMIWRSVKPTKRKSYTSNVFRTVKRTLSMFVQYNTSYGFPTRQCSYAKWIFPPDDINVVSLTSWPLEWPPWGTVFHNRSHHFIENQLNLKLPACEQCLKRSVTVANITKGLILGYLPWILSLVSSPDDNF